jgi:REP element-mobilizing transposase RayT
MPASLFVHVTWATLDRLPMIDEQVGQFLRRFLPAEARRHRAQVLALGLVADHVHVVLRLPGAFDLPRLVQGFKGASARLVNADPAVSVTGLRWAAGYDARSVSPRSLGRAVSYVRGQAQHHPDRRIEAHPRPSGRVAEGAERGLEPVNPATERSPEPDRPDSRLPCASPPVGSIGS